MNINAVNDAIKALAQSLQIATVFPAAMLVLANVYLILPLASIPLEASLPTSTTIIIGLTLMLSYTLYAFNFPLIRLLEGYKLETNPLRTWLLSNKRQWHDYFVSEVQRWQTLQKVLENRHPDPSELATNRAYQYVSFELARLRYEFDRDYPASRLAVLPSALGNTIAAFEDYARNRYGMDTIALWPRLVPILKEADYLDFVTQEKAVFDFILNTGLVVTLLGGEFCVLWLLLGEVGASLISAAVATGILLVMYHGAILAARQWGLAVRVAFDLYRHDLHDRLGIQSTESDSFADEYDRWQAVSEFTLFKPAHLEVEFLLKHLEFRRNLKSAAKGDG